VEGSPKPRFLSSCKVWGLLYPPPSPIWVKFGTQVQAHGVGYSSMPNFKPKFYHDRHNYRLLLHVYTCITIQMTNFGLFGSSWASYVRTPCDRSRPNLVRSCKAYAWWPHFSSRSVHYVALDGWKPSNIQICHSAVAPPQWRNFGLKSGGMLEAPKTSTGGAWKGGIPLPSWLVWGAPWSPSAGSGDWPKTIFEFSKNVWSWTPLVAVANVLSEIVYWQEKMFFRAPSLS